MEPATPHPLYHRSILAGALIALLSVVAILATVSHAAFIDVTDTGGNSFAADSIELTDNDDGQTMYQVTGMTPGDVEERCITVSYTGGNDADVRLYADIAGVAGLAEYLDITVDADLAPAGTTTPGDFDCPAGFTADESVVATSKLDVFEGAANDYATGSGNTTFANGDEVVYRFVVQFDAGAPNLQDAQGEEVSDLAFTWEAQS